jgi:hypothetical protein
MSLKAWTGLCALVVALAAGAATPDAAKAPPRDVSVTSMVLDYAADVAPRLNVQSDGHGSYLDSKNLISQIQASGDWVLDARNAPKSTRRLTVDFVQPIAGSGPGGSNPTAPPAGTYVFRIIAKCSLYSHSLFNFTAGAVSSCPLHVGFDASDGKTYAFVMDPLAAANGPFPETNYATVTCIYPTTGSSACSQWKFTPSGTYIASDGTVKYRNVAKLLEDPTGAAIDHGDFYVSFSMIVAK